MNLRFQARRVELHGSAARCASSTSAEGELRLGARTEPSLGIALRGRSVLRKREGRDGPGLDFNLPPDIDEELHIRRTPLATTVRLLTPASWKRELEEWVRHGASYRTGSYQAASAKIGARALAETNALVWYTDADPKAEYSRQPTDAWLVVELLVDDRHMAEMLAWCRLAAADPALLPRLTLDGLHFTRHDAVALRDGYPTWAGFLDSRWPALAERYDFAFGRRTAALKRPR